MQAEPQSILATWLRTIPVPVPDFKMLSVKNTVSDVAGLQSSSIALLGISVIPGFTAGLLSLQSPLVDINSLADLNPKGREH
jgi:hypothetical protein